LGQRKKKKSADFTPGKERLRHKISGATKKNLVSFVKPPPVYQGKGLGRIGRGRVGCQLGREKRGRFEEKGGRGNFGGEKRGVKLKSRGGGGSGFLTTGLGKGGVKRGKNREKLGLWKKRGGVQ